MHVDIFCAWGVSKAHKCAWAWYSKWQAWADTAAKGHMPGQSLLLRYAHACDRAFRLDILRVRGPRPGGVQLAGLELFAAC